MEIENGPRHSEIFNPSKGYGFIQPQGGGKDVFVHILAVERAGLSTLKEGQQIQYEIVRDRGKTSAVKLTSSDPACEFRAIAAVMQ